MTKVERMVQAAESVFEEAAETLTLEEYKDFAEQMAYHAQVVADAVTQDLERMMETDEER